jgi:hypothetical protein
MVGGMAVDDCASLQISQHEARRVLPDSLRAAAKGADAAGA